MNTIVGAIIGILLALFFNLLFGPAGGIVTLGLVFGLIFSTHQRNKMIYDDLQLIKQKLEIQDPKVEEFEHVADDGGITDDRLRKVNEEIEKELEAYQSDLEDDKDHGKDK